MIKFLTTKLSALNLIPNLAFIPQNLEETPKSSSYVKVNVLSGTYAVCRLDLTNLRLQVFMREFSPKSKSKKSVAVDLLWYSTMYID